jgi:hypothetical protein
LETTGGNYGDTLAERDYRRLARRDSEMSTRG